MEQPNRPSTVRYVGILRHEQYGDLSKFAGSEIFKAWDTSPEAPPKRRPQDTTAAAPALSLDLLAFRNGAPQWPSSLLAKFPAGTPEYEKLAALKKEIESEFPPTPDAERNVDARTSGGCDYSLDDGAKPLDVTRAVELQATPADAFNVQRPGNLCSRFLY